MTVMEALQWANDKLKKEKVGDSPMLDAQVLLAHVLSVPKTWLFTHLDQELRAHEDDAFQKTVQRRSAHEPVAYITGIRAFYKRDFQVNHFVLLPRPATEILVDAAIEASKASDQDATIFADIGTGSGAIGVTLAAETQLPVIATDVSKPALAVAKGNAEELGAAELVDLRQGELLEPLVKLFQKISAEGGSASGGKNLPFKHLILCANLPYLTEVQWEQTEPEVKQFEPKSALVGGADGLDIYWEFSRQLVRHRAALPKKITLLFEIDPDQSDRAQKMIRHDFPRSAPRVLKDLEGFDRVIVAEV
jgi:release factor glutamine methyltransferase